MRVALICVGAALACAALRPARPELPLAIGLAGGLAALLALRDELAAVAALLRELLGESGLSEAHAGLLFKALGIALICEFAAGLCRDAGETALAGRVELGARIVLLGLAVPLVEGLLALISAFCT